MNAYLLALTHAQLMREAVDKVQRAVLAEIPLYNDLESDMADVPRERITDPKLAYLSQDEEGCAAYFAECNRREREGRIKPADMPDEHCPALVAENLQTQAEWAILDAYADMMELRNDEGERIDGQEVNHLLLCMGLEKRRDAIELMVKLVVNRPGYKRPEIPVAA